MEWKSLEEFPDYQFSDTGLVKKKGKYHKVFLSRGYPSIVISNKLIRKQVRVHRIIAELFIGSHVEGQVVRHLDDDRENNRVSNLAYGTQKENMEDAVRNDKTAKGERNGLRLHPEKAARGEDHGLSKLTVKDVIEIKTAENYLGCVKDLSKKFNVSSPTISNIRNGKTWCSV